MLRIRPANASLGHRCEPIPTTQRRTLARIYQRWAASRIDPVTNETALGWTLSDALDRGSVKCQPDSCTEAVAAAFAELLDRHGLDPVGQLQGNSVLWCTPLTSLSPEGRDVDRYEPGACFDITVWVDPKTRRVEVEVDGEGPAALPELLGDNLETALDRLVIVTEELVKQCRLKY